MKKFIDDVAVLAIEQTLIKHLPEIFTPDKVLSMEDEEIAMLASETEYAAVERARCASKLVVLESGRKALKQLGRHDREI